MDLTQAYPRSPYEQLDGLTWLPRMIDKARAHVAGTVGEYSYPCGMDRAALDFYGVSAEAILDLIRAEASDEAIARYVRAHMFPRSTDELEAFRFGLLFAPPQEDEHCALLEQLRSEMGPKGRTIRTFAEAIAIDENWPIPKSHVEAP